MATRNESKTPWTATHPGTILRYELEDREISQKDFAVMIGMQKSHLNELIKGKRPITKPIADKIEEVLGISAVSLVNMQTQYEYDMKVIEQRGVEEFEAQNALSLYNEIFGCQNLVQANRQRTDYSGSTDAVYFRNPLSAPACRAETGDIRHV